MVNSLQQADVDGKSAAYFWQDVAEKIVGFGQISGIGLMGLVVGHVGDLKLGIE